MRSNIIKMDIFITPFKIVNNSFVSELLFNNKNVLKEVNDSFFDVKVIKLGYHCFLVFEVSFVLVNKGIAFINDVSNVVKDGAVGAFI